MEATGETSIHRLSSTPVEVAIDAAETPVLNPAAARVLLRILLRAGERHGLTNASHSSDPPVLSDS